MRNLRRELLVQRLERRAEAAAYLVGIIFVAVLGVVWVAK